MLIHRRRRAVQGYGANSTENGTEGGTRSVKYVEDGTIEGAKVMFEYVDAVIACRSLVKPKGLRDWTLLPARFVTA